MKKIISVISIIALVISLTACYRTEVSKEPIDYRYTEQSQAIKTEYKHKYSFLKGEFVMIPEVKTVTVPEKYEIKYRITYDDGSTSEEWREVGKLVYDNEKRLLS